MAGRPLGNPLPADLPENWTSGQIIAPSGADVGLSQQHGYNYLMEQVNAAQRAANAINESFDTISGKRTCRFTIGTSAAGWTQADCDYLCDGTDDQEELNAAITAICAKGGGEIAFLAGEYAFSELVDIELPGGSLTISGEPGSVAFKLSKGIRLSNGDEPFSARFFGLTFQLASSSAASVFSQGASIAIESCTFQNVGVSLGMNAAYNPIFIFKGNRVEIKNPPAAQTSGIHLITTTAKGILIEGNTFNGDFGPTEGGPIIFVQAYCEDGSIPVIVTNNIVIGSGAQTSTVDLSYHAVAANNFLSGASMKISSCTALGNNIEKGEIIANSGAVFGNRVLDGLIAAYGASTVSGNYIKAAVANPAIVAAKNGSSDPEDESPCIAGNCVAGGNTGIWLQASPDFFSAPEIAYALVTGNRIFGCTTPIQIDSDWSHCMVTDNLFPDGSSVVDNGTDNIVRLNSDDAGGGSGGGTSGVSSFNGRTGAVTPKFGDYTSALVGAIPTGDLTSIHAVTQAEYDALPTKTATTLYLIKE